MRASLGLYYRLLLSNVSVLKMLYGPLTPPTLLTHPKILSTYPGETRWSAVPLQFSH